MFRRIILSALTFLVCATGMYGADIDAKKPRLVVGIVVEQMRYDYLQRFWPKLSSDGFKKLVSEGVYFENVRHNNFFTQSSVGFATIATGTTPSIHGITGDRWYINLLDKETYCVEDGSQKSVGGTSYSAGQMSPKNIMTTTFADQLKLYSRFRSKVVGIGMDASSAIIPAGHTADIALWYEDSSGEWITSSYYNSALPTWVAEFNRKRFPLEFLQQTWITMLPVADYDVCITGPNTYAPGINGVKTFPYVYDQLSKPASASSSSKDYSVLRCSPWANTFTKDFAIAAMDGMELGKDDITDFISIAFSATENITAAFGPSSMELMDSYIRLDNDIAHLIRYIEATAGGKENVLIYLTSDRGTPEIPEYLASEKIPVGSFNYISAVSLLKSYLNLTYGEAEWVKGYYQQQLYLNRNLIEERKMNLEEIQNVVARFMIQFAGVAHVMTSSALEKTHFTDNIFGAMQKGFHQKRSGDVIINLMPGWVEKGDSKRSSSSPYSYDTHVPLVMYGWQIKPAVISETTDITVLAPTLSSLLKIPAPDAALGEAVKGITE